MSLRSALGVAISVLGLALGVAPGVAAADRPNIERVVVSRALGSTFVFRIEFEKPIMLTPETTIQVALDTDRDSSTGNDGLEYSLDRTEYPSLLVATPGGKTEEKTDSSLTFVQAGNVAKFSIVATDIGDPARFDFYVFIEIGDELVDQIPPHHLLFSELTTYPKEALAPGAPYPVETYEDKQGARMSRLILLGVLGVLGLGAVLAVGGWAFERRHRRVSR
jgi:hypothetical protein